MPRKKSSKPSPNLKQNKAKIELNQKMAEKAAKAEMPKVPEDKYSASAKRMGNRRQQARAAADARRMQGQRMVSASSPAASQEAPKQQTNSRGRAMQRTTQPTVSSPTEKVVGSSSKAGPARDYSVKSTTNVPKPAATPKSSLASKAAKVVGKAAGLALRHPLISIPTASYLAIDALPDPVKKSGIKPTGGRMQAGRKMSQNEKAQRMTQQSFDQTKGRSEAAIKAGKKDALSEAKASGVKKPAATGNAASAPKAKSERPAHSTKMKGANLYDSTPAPVIDKSTSGKSKKMKRNAGYDNYLDIMSSPGLANGGRVPGGYELDMSPMGMVKNAIRAVKDIKKGMQSNAPKASSTNQGPVERKSPRKDGRSGRELVPESLMDDVRSSRGYANGGKVGHSDMYGSYGGSGGMAKHVVKVEKTNLKRNGG